MATLKTTGTCSLCKREFAKAAMTKHLAVCPKLSLDREMRVHLVVEGNPPSTFWLHLAVKPSAKLADVDRFLRAIWLECCDHLSMFRIGGISYFSSGSDTGGRKMHVAVEKVLWPELKVDYEYDFGSTTALKLRVLGACPGRVGTAPIDLLARNNPPALACICGKPATEICTQCAWEGEGWLCAGCADEHACGEESLLPVVNSPRVGVCGYTG
jgi:hypothetical protein